MSDAAGEAGAEVEMEGVRFAALSEQQTIAAVLGGLSAGRGGWVCPVNLDVLRQCTDDPELVRLVNSADLIVADGMPLIWLARLRGTPIPERVAGSSLILSLPEALATSDCSLFLLGGNPGAADGAADELRGRNPGLRVVGTHCPPMGFESDPDELARIESALATAAADVVFVGLGFPKQDRLIADLRSRFPATWFISCGISFSFVTGEVARAPQWLQAVGLEWLHRLWKEPRRLARRYLVDGLPFAARLAASSFRQRLRRQA